MRTISLTESPASQPSVCPLRMAHVSQCGGPGNISTSEGSIQIPRQFLADLVRLACPGLHILDFPDSALEMGAHDAASQALSESISEHFGEALSHLLEASSLPPRPEAVLVQAVEAWERQGGWQ
jgi:hypothetical protein